MPIMPNQFLPTDPLLTEKEAARMLGVSPYWFQKVRSQNRDGPVVTRIGGAIRYRLSALEEYNEKNTVSPSDIVQIDRKDRCFR
jgi:predicted DNA-binding transcriptional regulator AlpA